MFKWINSYKVLLVLICFFSHLYAFSGTVIFLEIRSSINPATVDYIQSGIEKAKAKNADLLMIELDTPGGLLQSTRTIAQAIEQSTVPVLVYVTPAGSSATSAGALIMLASHIAAMAPGTNIGAAHPVGVQGEDQKGAMGEKVVNDTAAFARGLAEIRGRNIKLAEEVVSKSKSYTAEEALKNNLIDHLAETKEDLFVMLEGKKVKVGQVEKELKLAPVQIQKIEMSLGQQVLDFLANPNVAAMLMSLAMLLIYVEISNPGFGVPGVLGVICLLVAFVSFQILPIYSGGIILILLGLVFLVAEIFIVSGGILAIGGIIAFILGLLWAVDPTQTDMIVDRGLIAAIAVVLIFFVGSIGYLLARSSKNYTKLRKKIGGGFQEGLFGYTGKIKSIDLNRKKGQVFIRGELWNFQSEEPLEVGDEVEVVVASNLTLNVKKKENKGEENL